MDEVCSSCKSDYCLNPLMKLLVSPCYHKVCENCIVQLYSHGAAPCPVCGIALRKNSFMTPRFEDIKVEKECRIRKKVAAMYRDLAKHVDSTRERRTLMLFRHTMTTLRRLKISVHPVSKPLSLVFDLANDVNVQQTNAKLEAYRLQNLELIARNRGKQEQEEKDRKIHEIQQEEKRQQLHEEAIRELELEEQQKKNQSLELIDALARSTESATAILAKRKTAVTLASMPSLKGLKTTPKPSSLKIAPLDPLETVHEEPLPTAGPPPSCEYLCAFFGIDASVKAGGIDPLLLWKQAQIASLTWK